MATIPKGESYKGQEVYIASAFPQKGKMPNGQPMTGYNVALGIANDRREPDKVITNPMLVYNKYKDAAGDDQVSFTQSYSKDQYEAMQAAANKDGDAAVLKADLIPSKKGGFVINTKTLQTPEKPFDAKAHKENTEQARAERQAKRDAEVGVESAPEAESDELEA